MGDPEKPKEGDPAEPQKSATPDTPPAPVSPPVAPEGTAATQSTSPMPKAVIRTELESIQREILKRLQALSDSSSLLAQDDGRRQMVEHEIALLREAERNSQQALESYERDEQRDEKRAERRGQLIQQFVMGAIALFGLLVAVGTLYVHRSNAELNRATAELNSANILWNKERALAAAQWKEPVELKLRALAAGRLKIRNESRVEAQNLEVTRTRLFYSPSCRDVFRYEGHTWAQLERLQPYASVTLALEDPFSVPLDALTNSDRTCPPIKGVTAHVRVYKRHAAERYEVATLDPLGRLGAPVEFFGRSLFTAEVPDAGSADGGQLASLCSLAAPCRVIEFVRATAVHAKTFERSRDFDEFFLVGDGGTWQPSGAFGTPISHTQAGKATAYTFKFSEPDTQALFTDVATWLTAQPRSPADNSPPSEPFTVGIWRATGVEPPK